MVTGNRDAGAERIAGAAREPGWGDARTAVGTLDGVDRTETAEADRAALGDRHDTCGLA